MLFRSKAGDVVLEDLRDVLADPAIEKIFHASEYDLLLLSREHRLQVRNLFDTMWAARCLGHTHMGLAGFLRDVFNVHQRKRFQKTNWCKRPLSDEQLAYAQADTHYLIRLRDYFHQQLVAEERWEEAQEIFAREERVRLNGRAFDPDDFWGLRGARDLSPRKRAVLRALYVWRDEEARRRDQPPFKIVNNETLVKCAKHLPESPAALRQVPGISDTIAARWGKRMLRAVEQGRQDAIPVRPRGNDRPTQDETARYEQLLQWRKQQAQARGVESDVILTRDAILQLPRANPQTLDELLAVVELGPCRRRLYAQALLDALACV